MRRSFALFIAGLLCLAIVTPAAAPGPEKTRLEPTSVPPEVFAGTCDFPVELVDTFASSNEFAYPVQANGDQLYKYTGGFKSTITNLAPGGATLDIKYFGHVDYLYRANGMIDVRTSGTVLYWITGADTLSLFKPGIYLITGSMRGQIDGDTGLGAAPEQVKGRIVDLCAGLAS
jgi:hypothetical protein